MSIFDGLRQWWERRFHVSQTPPAWVDTWGGLSTVTGQQVSPETALQVSAVFSCVRILAETVASLPLILYRRREDGGKDRATDHPLYSILHDVANTEMSAYDLRETLMGHVALWGNAFAEIELNQRGNIVGLWPLRPDRMTVKRADGDSGELQYSYRLSKADAQGRLDRVFAPWQILHIRGLGSNGIVGYSVISLARQAIGLAMATEEFGGRFFGNGARPGVVLEHPGKLSETAEENLRKSWLAQHGGLEKAHRVAILEEGVKIHEVGMPLEDAQFLQTRTFQVRDIARWFRISPHLLGDLERATFSNIEHLGLEFGVYTLTPWLVRWEQQIKRSLLTTKAEQGMFAEHLMAGLLRGDLLSRYQAYAIGRQNGWLSANDVRSLENMNPIADGDMYLVPLNMIPPDQVGQDLPNSWKEPPSGEVDETDETDERSLCTCGREHRLEVSGGQRLEARALRSARSRHRLARSYQRVYRDTAGRILRREMSDVRRQAERMLGSRDYGQFSVWLEEFYREHLGFVARNMKALKFAYGDVVAAEAQDEVGQETGLTPELVRYIQRYVEAYASRHSYQSEAEVRAAVQAALEEGTDPLEALEELFGRWEERRPAEIAEEETTRFNNALARMVYVIAGVIELRWVAFGESCPYCTALNGQVVGINQFFIPAGTDYQPDGADKPLRLKQNVGHGPAHDGCDCLVVAG